MALVERLVRQITAAMDLLHESVLAECTREAIDDGPHQVIEEGALPGLYEDIRRHSGGRPEILYLLTCIPLIEQHSHDERIPPCRIRLACVARAQVGHDISREINHFALDHWRQPLIQSRQPDERVLSLIHVCDFVRLYTCLNDEFVVERKELQNDTTRSNNSSGRILIKLDDDPAHGRPHVGPLYHVLGSKNLLSQIVEVGFRPMQFLDSLLRCSRT